MFFGDILSVRCEILTHKYKGLEKPALVWKFLTAGVVSVPVVSLKVHRPALGLICIILPTAAYHVHVFSYFVIQCSVVLLFGVELE